MPFRGKYRQPCDRYQPLSKSECLALRKSRFLHRALREAIFDKNLYFSMYLFYGRVTNGQDRPAPPTLLQGIALQGKGLAD